MKYLLYSIPLIFLFFSCKKEQERATRVAAAPAVSSIDSAAIARASVEADSLFRVGLRSLKSYDQLTVQQLELKVGAIQSSRSWRFDRYPGNTRVEAPDSGYVFLCADIQVSTVQENPLLPVIGLYKMAGQSFEIVDAMTWMFYEWKNEQFYLGNKKDDSNRLGPGRRVRFSPGMAIPEAVINDQVLVLAVSPGTCARLAERPFDNPPLYYDTQTCRVKGKLSLEDLQQEYKVLKVFNLDKL